MPMIIYRKSNYTIIVNTIYIIVHQTVLKCILKTIKVNLFKPSIKIPFSSVSRRASTFFASNFNELNACESTYATHYVIRRLHTSNKMSLFISNLFNKSKRYVKVLTNTKHYYSGSVWCCWVFLTFHSTHQKNSTRTLMKATLKLLSIAIYSLIRAEKKKYVKLIKFGELIKMLMASL